MPADRVLAKRNIIQKRKTIQSKFKILINVGFVSTFRVSL